MLTHPDPVASTPAGSNSDRRRLLVITYHFPPDGAVGGMRWAGLTKYLAQLGWEVWVLTAAPAGPAGPDGVTVESCPPGRTLSDRYFRLRDLLRGTASAAEPPHDGAANPAEPDPSHLLDRLRAEGATLLGMMDEGRGWVLRAAVRARRLIARVRPHVVVSTSPPHLVHLAAWLATRGRRLRWLVDLRDPWAGPVPSGWRSHPYLRSRLTWGTIARLERLVVRSASGVVTTTPELAEALRARYPQTAVSWVSNAADRELLPCRSRSPYPGLSIAHVGTLYGGRDLTPVLRALRVFLDRHPEAASDGTRLRCAGHAEGFRAAGLQREIAALHLGRHVDLLGVVPRGEAVDLLARSQLAVVLAQEQEVQVPAKLYEALATGIPTLVITDRDSASGREAARLGAAVVEPHDVDAIVGVFASVWSDGEGSFGRGQIPVDYRDVAAPLSELLGSS